jgi:hypothetical protein
LFIFRVQFVLLLFLRHSLPVLLGGVDDFSITLLMLPLVRTLGILLIAYVFFKSFIVIQRCRQERVRNNILWILKYDLVFDIET